MFYNCVLQILIVLLSNYVYTSTINNEYITPFNISNADYL